MAATQKSKQDFIDSQRNAWVMINIVIPHIPILFWVFVLGGNAIDFWVGGVSFAVTLTMSVSYVLENSSGSAGNRYILFFIVLLCVVSQVIIRQISENYTVFIYVAYVFCFFILCLYVFNMSKESIEDDGAKKYGAYIALLNAVRKQDQDRLVDELSNIQIG